MFFNDFVFKESVNINFLENSVEFHIENEIKKIKLSQLSTDFFYVIKMIYSKSKSSEIINEVGIDTFTKVITYLLEKNLIIKNFNNKYIDTKLEKQVEYFSEFTDSPELIPDKLSQQKVLIIGLGGTGCIVLQHLISAGIYNFICIDNDIVHPSNLNRQFCYKNIDIGRYKTESIKKFALSIEPKSKISCYNKFIKTHKDLDEILAKENNVNLVICCADTPPILIQNIVLQSCMKNNIPCGFSGVGIHSGYWGPIIVDTNIMEKYYDLNNKLIKSHTNSNNINIISASIGFTNTIISTFFSKDIIMHLAGLSNTYSLNKIVNFNFNNYSINQFEINN